MVTLEDLKNSGWQATAKLAPRRSIMSIEGLDKSGKSRLAMSAPEPIVYLDLDVGTEGVIEPMMAQREILLYQVEQPSKLGTQSQVMDMFSAVWQDIQARVSEALQLESGTLVIDTFGEAYEICRLALRQVSPGTAKPVRQLLQGSERDMSGGVQEPYELHPPAQVR